MTKASVWSRDGRCLEKLTRPTCPATGEGYGALDTAATADWLIEALASLAHHPVEAIVPVAHGAAIAAIRDGTLAFAPVDYEWTIPGDIAAAYARERDPFAVTGSPALPGGLNIGSQLAWLDLQGMLDGVTLMPYAQYWAWLFCGVAASEVTSLGCHSDLWAPAEGGFSPMARQRGWAERFAPLVRAGDFLGTIRPELAKRTGLSPEVRVLAGLHDSNAALLAARSFPELSGSEATVLSTGTWFIAMRSPQEPVDLSALPEDRDCLVNVDAFGQPVPSARFMGGREVELLGERIDCAGTDGVGTVLAAQAMVLPSQVPGCGPFPDAPARWIAEPAPGPARTAAVALYAALMADAALDLIGTRARLLIEGRFAASEIFVRALAALRPDTDVYTAGSEADVSFGALTLAVPGLAARGTLARAEPLDCDMAAYRAAWRMQNADRTGNAEGA
ncbi:FGGY-family carbohydrate kinase [Novosphingobium sp. TH158]|uniref:FGGY-family carbohydrate kinase n=1 Tax=Novosphingobium sp. TH158 TaxID=2067455 RepID=UPI0020B10A74|nr:carbohydrate kinase [Novosphingobium sp. TH158]